MLITTNQEFRFHNPSNAVDELNLLQGILDNSEKDLLRDKLGAPLYNRLCQYYNTITPEDFFLSVTSGTYTEDPFAELLNYAQRIIANDAMAHYLKIMAISANSTGVNVVGSGDFAPASDKKIEDGEQGCHRVAFIALNNMFVTLEGWAKELDNLSLMSDLSAPQDEKNDIKTDNRIDGIKEIVSLWQHSKYYYLHSGLLIPTCQVLYRYLDNYDNRDKYIRMLPDFRFIQEEYIEPILGRDLLKKLLHADDDDVLLDKVRKLMVAYLKERTIVISFDKFIRQQGHNDAIALKASVLAIIADRKKAEAEATTNEDNTPTPSTDNNSQDEGYKNNQPGSRMFVSPLLY